MAKSQNPAGETIEKTLTFDLTEAEVAQKGELAAEANNELFAAEEEFAQVKRSWTDKIKKIQARVKGNLRAIHSKREDRLVTCTMVKNWDSFEIEYWFEGTVQDSRPMTPDERQQDLTPQSEPIDIQTKIKKRKGDLKSVAKKAEVISDEQKEREAEFQAEQAEAAKNKLVDHTSKTDEMMAHEMADEDAAAAKKKKGPKLEEETGDRARDLRDVHRMETSRHTKRSSVDQPPTPPQN